MNTISAFIDQRKNNFDFIRFMAASAVVYSHSYPIVSGENDLEPLYLLTRNQTTIGGTSVAIFFMLSGFLITQSFINSKNILRYVLSRALRIFPALALMVVCCVVILGPAATTLQPESYFTNPGTYRYLWNAVAYIKFSVLPGVFKNVPFANVVNGSLWTLPVEFYFYILVPAIGLLLMKKFLQASAFAALALLLLNIQFLPTTFFFIMANYFLCGALFYLFRKKIVLNKWLAVLSAILILVSIYLNIYVHTFGIFGGYLILYFGLKIKAGLNNFARYGDFSYGIYIWAFPIQQWMVLHGAGQKPIANFLASYPVILVLAVISWHLVEKRSLAYKERLQRILA
jgi:peptidoglycan/LPS O-acetylase OafA/YrhL